METIDFVKNWIHQSQNQKPNQLTYGIALLLRCMYPQEIGDIEPLVRSTNLIYQNKNSECICFSIFTTIFAQISRLIFTQMREH